MRNFQLPGRSPAFSKQGMVATSHPIACTVGIEILKRGGNAIDAAIMNGAYEGSITNQIEEAIKMNINKRLSIFLPGNSNGLVGIISWSLPNAIRLPVNVKLPIIVDNIIVIVVSFAKVVLASIRL